MVTIRSTKSRIIDHNTNTGARPCFIFAGQSNVDGYQFTSALEAQYQQTYNRVKFYQYSSTNNVKFTAMDYTSNPAYQAPNQTARYALQFYLYPDLQALVNKDIYIVHHAQGGTALAVEWLSTSVTGLYVDLLFKTKATKSVITEMDGIAPDFKFMYWGQGETDAANVTNAGNYQTNLTNLINNFRTATGLTNLPILIGRINSGIDTITYPFWNTVRIAQTAVCQGGGSAISGVYLVDQDNATLAVDNTHYTQDGYRTIAANIISVAQANGLI